MAKATVRIINRGSRPATISTARKQATVKSVRPPLPVSLLIELNDVKATLEQYQRKESGSTVLAFNGDAQHSFVVLYDKVHAMYVLEAYKDWNCLGFYRAGNAADVINYIQEYCYDHDVGNIWGVMSPVNCVSSLPSSVQEHRESLLHLLRQIVWHKYEATVLGYGTFIFQFKDCAHQMKVYITEEAGKPGVFTIRSELRDMRVHSSWSQKDPNALAFHACQDTSEFLRCVMDDICTYDISAVVPPCDHWNPYRLGKRALNDALNVALSNAFGGQRD